MAALTLAASLSPLLAMSVKQHEHEPDGDIGNVQVAGVRYLFRR
jgi:hypothetical protein